MKITSQLEQYHNDNVKICKKFSRRLKKLKNDRGMTLDEIADILGISRQSVVYYAMGDRLPSIPILIRIANLFGTSVDYMLGVSNKGGLEEQGGIIMVSLKKETKETKVQVTQTGVTNDTLSTSVKDDGENKTQRFDKWDVIEAIITIIIVVLLTAFLLGFVLFCGKFLSEGFQLAKDIAYGNL